MESDGQWEVIYFPPYSPDENPQEHVWKAGRSAVTHNNFIPDIEQASGTFVTYLNDHTFPYKFFNLTAQS